MNQTKKRRHHAFILTCTGIYLIILMCLPSGLFAADDQVSKLIQGMQERYGKLPGFSVTYTREIQSKSMAMLGDSMKTDSAAGKMFFRAPHALRVEQETPKPETLISDGSTLWWYLPYKKQAYRYPEAKIGREIKILSDIFYGLKMVGEHFDITPLDQDDLKTSKLRLTPTPPWPDIMHIDILVVEGSYDIRKVEILNAMGGITRFILNNLTVEPRFKEGFFAFEIPAGVKLMEEEQ